MKVKVLILLVIQFAAVLAGSAPSFEVSFENVTAKEGSMVEIICMADGDKPMLYEWNRFDEDISEGIHSFIFISHSENASSLVIRNVIRSHGGVYICKASNEHGLASKVYELVVFPSSSSKDSSILNVTLLNITSNSVRFHIDFDLARRSSTLGVLYNESAGKEGWDVTSLNNLGLYGTEFEAINLIPGGLYTFRFEVDGNFWPEAYEVTLLPDRPEVILQNLENGNVKLQWHRPIDDIMRNTTDRYQLTYYTVQMVGGSKWEPSKCAITIQIPTCAGPSYTISGLYKDVFYEIELRAHTASGYGEPYKQKIFFPRQNM